MPTKAELTEELKQEKERLRRWKAFGEAHIERAEHGTPIDITLAKYGLTGNDFLRDEPKK